MPVRKGQLRETPFLDGGKENRFLVLSSFVASLSHTPFVQKPNFATSNCAAVRWKELYKIRLSRLHRSQDCFQIMS